MIRIARDEYRRRIDRLRSEVDEADLDLFLVTSLDSIYYLTGTGFEPLERPFFLLIGSGAGRGPVLLVPRLDGEHMGKARDVVGEIHTYREYPAPEGRRWIDRLRTLIGPARHIGIEPSLRLEVADELRDLSTRIVPLVERLRLTKSEAEVAMIRRAARYADRGVEQLLAASYAGAMVAEGFARTGRLTKAIIHDLEDWEPLTNRVLMATWAAPRSAQPHSIPSLIDRLGDGPHVALALLRVNGYAAESERTYFTSPPSEEMRRAFRAMEEARRVAFRRIRPGVPCGELDSAVNEFLRAEGYHGEECRLHRTGHGIGLGNHEAPWIAEGSTDLLDEGMVISIEPGVYLPGMGGYRHSDTVLVTGDGCECLTTSPTDLETLTMRGWKPMARIPGRIVRHAMGLDRKDRQLHASPTPGR